MNVAAAPVRGLAFCLACFALASAALPAADPPNVIIIYADDLGYGDLGCYGHPTLRTPHLDRMAAEGLRFTAFYSAAEVCTPSRAALLTGRLPPRNGMCSDARRVLFPNSAGGLPASEITLAEGLKSRGYATACIGKWHLGHLPEYLPLRHGFDAYFGIPYSNDMDRTPEAPKGRDAFLDPRIEYWNVPLVQNREVVERPADQRTLTKRYTQAAVDFIQANRERPFFLYFAHTFPHVPLFTSSEHLGRSPRGLYGDVVEELDASVGRVLQTLRETGLQRRTLVVFSSDNGPWLTYDQQGGSAGLLRDGKGSTWEGGMRVPGIFWWPSKIAAGKVTQEMASTLDLLPTCIKLSGGELPTDRTLDGFDLGPLLFGDSASPRDTMFYYRGTRLFALRKAAFKAHFLTQTGYGQAQAEAHDPPLLYHLGHDPGERFDVARQYPEVVAEMIQLAAAQRASLEPAPSQLEKVAAQQSKR